MRQVTIAILLPAAAIACAAACSFSPTTAGSIIDCADGRACPEGWHCPAEGKKVCVEGAAPDAGAPADAGADGGSPADAGSGGDAGTGDAGEGDAGAGDAGTGDGGPACADECPSAGAVTCAGAGAYRICGDHDGDGCREWGPDQPCASGCADDQCGGCAPACGGKQCGGDGCGGSCGSCDAPPKAVCLDARKARTYASPGTCAADVCAYASADKDCYYGCAGGACVDCTPSCTGKQCGDDGCGEPCGLCDKPPADTCLDGSTLRDYDLAGTCLPAWTCSYAYTDLACPNGCANGACKGCQPACGGKACGGDGCGGSCGSCGKNQSCAGGTCACNAGFKDCDGDSGNGCEANLATDTGNCGDCGRGCTAGGECARASCQNGGCVETPINEGGACGGQGDCYRCKGGACACFTPHYECPSCTPSCGILGGSCCPSTMHCDDAGEKGASNDCDYCCAGACLPP
jgi:hypothetical protein